MTEQTSQGNLSSPLTIDTSAINADLRHVFFEASLNTSWSIDPSEQSITSIQDTDRKKVIQVLSHALNIFHEILGPFPYVTINLRDNELGLNTQEASYTQLHLSRPNNDPEKIAVHLVPNGAKGARYSDIQSRVFGNKSQVGMVAENDSIGEHFTNARANAILQYAQRSKAAISVFQTNDIVLHLNPQGIQEFVNQPLGGFHDTGGQNKYVECFARALGVTLPSNKENAPSQLIINRAGPSQVEILQNSTPPQTGGDPAVRKGLHFFPDDNVCLAFVEDNEPEVFKIKENSHPTWKKIDSSLEDFNPAGKDIITVSGERLSRFGIADGTYLMTQPGPMHELAKSSLPFLNYFNVTNPAISGREVVLANHYADAAYLAEFIAREAKVPFKSFFFMHSLGTYKAEGLDYPSKLTSDVSKAAELDKQLRLTNRILSELWVVQRCKQSLIANSAGIADHAHRYLGARHEPPTMIAVDDAATGHIERADRRHLALKTFHTLYKFYLNTCENEVLGEIIPLENRLTLDQLIDALIIFERSRHAEALSKGKWAVVKAMAIAESDEDAKAMAKNNPQRILIVNVNLAALHGKDPRFKEEIVSIIADIKSIRKNGGHVIVQPSFDYHLGLDIAKVADCYVALPAFEPFGMGVLEAALAGAAVIARSDVPAVREVLVRNTSTVKFPLRNNKISVGLADGAILVGGHPDNTNPNTYTQQAYEGTAAAINAITLGIQPTTAALSFDPRVMGKMATKLVAESDYNWTSVANRFLREAYE